MPSDLVVPVVQIENVRAHPNADKLELCNVLGYQMAVPKGKMSEGEVCVYFPADTLISRELADSFGVTGFLRGSKKDRVGRIRLRGEPSFGLVVSMPEGVDWEVGDNVAEHFDVKKYEPPLRQVAGDCEAWTEEIDPYFRRYTKIPNGRLTKGIFEPGESVIVTEKIHGTNCKLGFINGVMVAGSMGDGDSERFTGRRKHPEIDGKPADLDSREVKSNTYWCPWAIEGVNRFLEALVKKFPQAEAILLYGEVFGQGVQSLNYGIPNHSRGFRAFDLSIDGVYVDWKELEEGCELYGVPLVPVLHRGPFDMEQVLTLSDGPTTLEGDHIREGVVVKPEKERTDPAIGRVVLKFIGTEYELSSHKKKDTTDT